MCAFRKCLFRKERINPLKEGYRKSFHAELFGKNQLCFAKDIINQLIRVSRAESKLRDGFLQVLRAKKKKEGKKVFLSIRKTNLTDTKKFYKIILLRGIRIMMWRKIKVFMCKGNFSAESTFTPVLFIFKLREERKGKK